MPKIRFNLEDGGGAKLGNASPASVLGQKFAPQYSPTSLGGDTVTLSTSVNIWVALLSVEFDSMSFDDERTVKSCQFSRYLNHC